MKNRLQRQLHISESLVKALNKELKGKMIKVAAKNGGADLEFGFSGSTGE